MIPSTRAELVLAVRDCRKMATKAGLKSAAAGALPVPLLDAAVDIRILSKLIAAINERFGLSEDQIETYSESMQLAVFDLMKRTGTRFVGRYMTTDLLIPALRKAGIRIATKQGAKYIPVLGTILAAGVSFAAVKALAHLHIRECEQVARRLIEEKRFLSEAGKGS
jgi:hypothetical protein